MSTLYDLANSPLHKNQIFDKKNHRLQILDWPVESGTPYFFLQRFAERV